MFITRLEISIDHLTVAHFMTFFLFFNPAELLLIWISSTIVGIVYVILVWLILLTHLGYKVAC